MPLTELTELTEFLVKSVVREPDMVSVKEFKEELTIQVFVSERDMGLVIGKGGKTANAIRTLVQAAAYQQNMGRVRVNFDSF